MVDFSNAFTGVTTGVGLAAPSGNPWLIGGAGLAGGLFGLFGGGKGKKPKLKEYERYSPEEREFMTGLLDQVKAGNQDAIEYYKKIISDDPEAFADFERPYMEQFEQETIPSILERINASSGMNKYSGAVTQQLAQAGRGLSTNLASLRANLKNNAIQGLQNYSEMGLREKRTPYTQEGTKGAFGLLAPAAGEGYSAWANSGQKSNDWQNFLNRFKGGI